MSIRKTSKDNEKTYDIVVAGVANLDITPRFLNDPVARIDEVLIPSKTVLTDKADISAGGCVSNTGLALAHFGKKVALMARIGNDHFGELLLEEYRKAGVDERVRVEEGEGTSYSVILSPPGIDRIFLHYPGGSMTFGEEDIDFSVVADAEWFHFGYPQVMRRMYAEDGAGLRNIFEKVKSLGVTTSLDTCGIDARSEAGRVDWKAVLKNVLPFVDLFLPSVEELCFMLDRERFQRWVDHAQGRDLAQTLSAEDVKPLAEEIFLLGGRELVMKCGERGLFYASADGTFLHQKTFVPKQMATATGAGDVCIAALLAELLSGEEIKDALRSAAAAGAACCEGIGALSAVPLLPDLKKRIADGWESL